jgi:hypothetical protein
MVIGTFLLGLALLSFEALSIRTMGFVLGSGYIYFAIALAMLAISAAGSCVSVASWRTDDRTRTEVLFWSCVLLAPLIVGSYYATVWFKEGMNAAFVSEGLQRGFGGAVVALGPARLRQAFALGALLSVPFFLFGFVLAYLFCTIDRRLYHRVYCAQLVGGGAGCLLAYALMEHATYGLSVMLPPIVCLFAAAAYVLHRSRGLALAALGAGAAASGLFAIGPLARAIEPQPELHSLARDYDYRGQVDELWHRWNSFSRIGAIRRVHKAGVEHVMAYGDGEGFATLKAYQPDAAPWTFVPSVMATALGAPARLLVLFAGTGADLLGVDAQARGAGDLTGVELSRIMVDGARRLPGFGLDAFYRRDNIHLQVAEARAYLERDRGTYDVVLLSWSGASPVYYDGSISSTTQYVFTREGMESILAHLNPNGYAVYLSTNKVNVVATLRRIMEARGWPHPERAVVVLAPKGPASAQWRTAWDTNPTLLKPSGFSRDEVDRLKTAAETIGATIVYSPFETESDEEYPAYKAILTHTVLDGALDALSDTTQVRFGVPTDDRPFAFDLFRTSAYLTRAFWSGAFAASPDTVFEQYRARYIIFTGVVVVAAVILIIGPLLITPSIRTNRATVEHLLFFASVGAGFMLIEVGVMQKVRLLLGDPGLATAVTLAVLVSSTGLGSLASAWARARGLTTKRATAALIAYMLPLTLLSTAWLDLALGWPTWGKCVWTAALLAPGGWLMGQLVPRGLERAARDDNALVPWAWAVNGVAGTVASAIVPLMSMAVGFRLVMLLGLACYAVVFWLPRYTEPVVETM